MSTGLIADDEKTEQADKAELEAAIAKSDKLIGEILANRYQIEVRLGEGAMGSVYKARHVKVGRPFAVKVLHKKLLEDRKVAQRFEREAELAGRLRHPNVVGVVDVGETHDGMRYMVMDFAQGTDLATLLSEAPMPASRIIHLTKQMLEGLYHAHEAGLIHRDFKPENVIVERDDHGTELPRIVDFGIAILREGGESANAQGRLTTNGLVLGTPHYMAPEQAVADPIDHRIDLFALGIVVYEMLCGKLPFDGTGAEVARANLLLDPPAISQRVPYLEVDPLLEAFARQLMAKKRDLRPPTAKAAREILDMIEKDRPAAAAALGVPLTVVRPPTHTEPGGVDKLRDENAGDLEIPVATGAPSAPAPASAGQASGPAVLGLAPAPGTRPTDPQPPTPQATPASGVPTVPVPSSSTTNGASTLAATPAALGAAATKPAPSAGARPARTSRERDIPTDATAPLSYDEGRSKKGWILGGVLVLAAAAITFFVMKSGDDKKPPAADQVAMQNSAQTGTQPDQKLTPDPTNPHPTNPTNPTHPTDPNQTNPANPTDPNSTNPANPKDNAGTTANTTDTTEDGGKTAETTKPKTKDNPKDKKGNGKRPGKTDKDKGKTVASSDKGKPVDTAKTNPTNPTNSTNVTNPTPPTPAVGPTSGDVIAQYSRVGGELKQLQQAKGENAVADLWTKYRLIQIQQAVRDQSSRNATSQTLGWISKEAAKRRTP